MYRTGTSSRDRSQESRVLMFLRWGLMGIYIQGSLGIKNVFCTSTQTHNSKDIYRTLQLSTSSAEEISTRLYTTNHKNYNQQRDGSIHIFKQRIPGSPPQWITTNPLLPTLPNLA